MEEFIFLTENINLKDFFTYGIYAIIPVVFKYIANKIKKFVEDINQKFENLAKLQIEHIQFYNQYLERKNEIDERLENIMLENERKHIAIMSSIDVLNTHWNEYRKAGIAVLKDRLTQSLRYFLKQGHTGLDAKRNIEELMHVYKMYGGNSVVLDLYEKYKMLPIDDINNYDINKLN